MVGVGLAHESNRNWSMRMTTKRRVLVSLAGALLVALGVWCVVSGIRLRASVPGAGENTVSKQVLGTDNLDAILKWIRDNTSDGGVWIALDAAHAPRSEPASTTRPADEVRDDPRASKKAKKVVEEAISEANTLTTRLADTKEALSGSRASERAVRKDVGHQLMLLGGTDLALGLVVILLGLAANSPSATPAPAPMAGLSQPATRAADFKLVAALENGLNRLYFATTGKATAKSVPAFASSLVQDVQDSLRSAGLAVTSSDTGVSSLLQRLEEAATSPGQGNVLEFAQDTLKDVQRLLGVRSEGLPTPTFEASVFERAKAFVPIEQVVDGQPIELVSPAWYLYDSVAIKGRLRKRTP